MKLFERLHSIFATARKRRNLSTLGGLSDCQLRDIGVDPAMLYYGIAGWPRRLPVDHWEPQTTEFRPSVRAAIRSATSRRNHKSHVTYEQTIESLR